MSLKIATSFALVASALLLATYAASAPPDKGGSESARPFQERDLANFSGSVATLFFSNPAADGEVLVVEFVSATLTTDPDSAQAVVDLEVIDTNTNSVVLNHRLVLAEQPPTGAGGTEAWEANQPILVFVESDQVLEISCVTNPPPLHVATGCRATIAGYIKGLAN